MLTVSIFEAKTHLSRFVQSLVDGREEQVVVSRRGKPVARITAIQPADTGKRIGIARGRFRFPADMDRSNDTIAALFGASGPRR